MDPDARLGGGRYVVKGVLGEGAQGVTYDAADAESGRAVAIKRFDVARRAQLEGRRARRARDAGPGVARSSARAAVHRALRGRRRALPRHGEGRGRVARGHSQARGAATGGRGPSLPGQRGSGAHLSPRAGLARRSSRREAGQRHPAARRQLRARRLRRSERVSLPAGRVEHRRRHHGVHGARAAPGARARDVGRLRRRRHRARRADGRGAGDAAAQGPAGRRPHRAGGGARARSSSRRWNGCSSPTPTSARPASRPRSTA